jgi:cytochrome d ubiquinol oxidase subunit I
MLNQGSFHQVVHMVLAAFIATGFSVAAVHAFFLLRNKRDTLHRNALGIALVVGCVSVPLQIWSGDLSARTVARIQPAKLAAMEATYQTQEGAPILIGGIPNDDTRTTNYAITIPRGLSLLAARDPQAKISGLEDFPRADWPNVRFVHWSFDTMIACGFALFAVSLSAAWLWWKQRGLPDRRWFLYSLVIAGPLGFIALEAGWMVTELGRQPWIIYGVMRTQEAVTPMPGIAVPFVIFTIVYLFLALMVVYLLRRELLKTTDPTTAV